MDKEKIDERPLMVSIRCITYNQEKYIRDALEGFVMQKTNFRFEAIVHDDASTDGTADIIREYAERYPDIIKPIYETENQYSKHDGSLGRIMNAACTGKYIAYCEGDDYWIDPLKLQKQVDFLETHPSYSMCWTDAFQETNGKKIPYNRYPKDFESPVGDIIEQGGLWIPTASTLYRNSVMLKFPKGVTICDYTYQMFAAFMGKVYYLAKPSCVYRYMSQGSWTSGVKYASPKYARNIYLGEMQILDDFNQLSDYKYNIFFERRAAGVLFQSAYSQKDYAAARYYLKLRDKYNISTSKVVRLEVEGFRALASLYRLYAKVKIWIMNSLNNK